MRMKCSIKELIRLLTKRSSCKSIIIKNFYIVFAISFDWTLVLLTVSSVQYQMYFGLLEMGIILWAFKVIACGEKNLKDKIIFDLKFVFTCAKVHMYFTVVSKTTVLFKLLLLDRYTVGNFTILRNETLLLINRSPDYGIIDHLFFTKWIFITSLLPIGLFKKVHK